jgi:hypothetical protein
MRPNTVKRLLRDGKPAIGTWLGLGSPLAAEWLAHQGFDWLNVEQEHGAIDATLTLSLLQAISTTDVIPLIRIPWKDAAHCKRALDAGAYGLFIPSVNTREEAELVVGAMKYPPSGYRGLGGTRRVLYGGSDYVSHANDEILVIPMIETADGVRTPTISCRCLASTPASLAPTTWRCRSGWRPAWIRRSRSTSSPSRRSSRPASAMAWRPGCTRRAPSGPPTASSRAGN